MKLLLTFLLTSFVAAGQTVNDLRPTVTMKEYVDMQLQLMEKINQVRDENIKDNVNKTNASIDKKFESVNEFRSQLKDQAGTFITRQELIAYIGMIIGIFFGWSNYNRGKEKGSGAVIRSGDNVEVKK